MTGTAARGRMDEAIGRGVLRPAAMLPAPADPSRARRFLERLRAPDVGCTELRVLNGAFDHRGRVVRGEDGTPGRRGCTLAAWSRDPDLLSAQARRLSGVSCYVTINPVRPDLLARGDGRLGRVRHTTRDVDVVCLRWLFLDIDPVRPPDISSTDEELAAAVARRDAILAGEPELAAAAIWGRSGNGGWILVRLPDYPNDQAHRALIAAAVKAIARRYSDPAVVVDKATVNPARLVGLPGTIKAKGAPRPERPWRPVTWDGTGCGLGGTETCRRTTTRGPGAPA
ncbi:MAG: hypothetical protein U0790_23720 [Isosphaeraceae bacterium]